MNQSFKISNLATPNLTNVSSNVVSTNTLNSNISNTEVLTLGLDKQTITGGATETLTLTASVTLGSNGGSGYPTFNLVNGNSIGQLKTVLNIDSNTSDYIYVYNPNIVGSVDSSTMGVGGGYIYIYGQSSVTLIWDGTNWRIYSAYNSKV